ncbi:MAG: hypothetical protein OXF62_19715, partial [Caldilineaceae bacterium]|nr:hypothetical protein [Caldilineaceae bacterium]
RIIGGRAPSDYLSRLEKRAKIGSADMDRLLSSHRIPVGALRKNDFRRFFASRAEGLLKGIEVAMGKKVTIEDGLKWLGTSQEKFHDGPTDWDENVD